MIWVLFIGFALGVLLGGLFPLVLPYLYVRYLSVAILACLDSVLGGVRAYLEHRFNETIFFSGFFVNAAMASFLVLLGDNLGVDLYLAAIVAFGLRIFQNIALIRRHVVDAYLKAS